MSNPLSVRRVLVQTIDENGKPDGEPSYGIMAADGYEQVYNDTWESLEDLNETIKTSASILDAVDGEGIFSDADHEKIGHDNFYGKDWIKDDEGDE